MIDCTLLFPHLTSVKISPNGKYLGESISKGIIVRSTETFAVVSEFALSWKADKIKWSPDSTLIFCWFVAAFRFR